MVQIEKDEKSGVWVRFAGRVAIHVDKDKVFFCIDAIAENEETTEKLKELSHGFYRKGSGKLVGSFSDDNKLMEFLKEAEN